MREIGRLVLVLGLICVFSATALSTVRTSLAPRIEMQSDLYVRGPALERIFGQPSGELLANKVTAEFNGQAYPVFYQRRDGEITGLAVETPGHGGYGGDIVFMVGLDLRSDQFLGVEIVSHSETPGVGAQVEKAGFRRQWQGLPLDRHAGLRTSGGQVDAITGATYSSDAMIDGTNQVVDLLRDQRAQILERIGGGSPSTASGNRE